MAIDPEHQVYQLIRQFYGNRKAERSGVPLINHIYEGLEILDRLDADEEVKQAYAIHPMVQNDADLANNFMMFQAFLPLTIMYAMEYRSVANDFLSDQVEIGPNAWGREEVHPRKGLRLSPLPGVNLMLVADKIQNRKDFLTYHAATHARSRELDFYFNHWLRALDISEERYQELVKDL